MCLPVISPIARLTRLAPVSCLILAVLLAGCNRAPKESPVPALAADFVNEVLALSPVSATAAGYHEHHGRTLDAELDDLSPAGISAQREALQRFRQRVQDLGSATLSPEDRADLSLIQDQIALSLLELDQIQNWRHNPTLYVELIGNALFTPHLLNYAPPADRYRHITARLQRVPAFLQAARANLQDAPEIWNRVAREENEGNIALIDGTLRRAVPADLRPEYEKAAAAALPALRAFNEWLASELATKPSDWRLGKAKYESKFRYALSLPVDSSELLQDAETSLQAVRREMLDIVKPGHGLDPGSPAQRDAANQLLRAALDRIAGDHATRDSYMGAARADLDEARIFVRESALLPLPLRDNLQLIETPEFMRGIYGVGGFNAAPPLQPELGAFYWLTPIPADWPAERVESKLREYNKYGLKILTIHEAMPGHYVQLEHANNVTPLRRRVLRSLFGNGPYVEGWAVYITEVMLNAGYLNRNTDLRLTFLKQQLRMIANTILDIRMQTAGMTDEEAMSLMLDSTFQEKEEAAAKLQRAKLSSAQLPTYFAGYREWRRIRAGYEKKKGADFRLYDFHEAALRPGAVSLKSLPSLLQ